MEHKHSMYEHVGFPLFFNAYAKVPQKFQVVKSKSKPTDGLATHL